MCVLCTHMWVFEEKNFFEGIISNSLHILPIIIFVKFSVPMIKGVTISYQKIKIKKIMHASFLAFMYHTQIYCLLVDEDDDANDIGMNDIFRVVRGGKGREICNIRDSGDNIILMNILFIQSIVLKFFPFLLLYIYL